MFLKTRAAKEQNRFECSERDFVGGRDSLTAHSRLVSLCETNKMYTPPLAGHKNRRTPRSSCPEARSLGACSLAQLSFSYLHFLQMNHARISARADISRMGSSLTE
jgi:hypothetical protein